MAARTVCGGVVLQLLLHDLQEGAAMQGRRLRACAAGGAVRRAVRVGVRLGWRAMSVLDLSGIQERMNAPVLSPRRS